MTNLRFQLQDKMKKKKKNLNYQMIRRLHYQIFTDISNK